jgi:integrase
MDAFPTPAVGAPPTLDAYLDEWLALQTTQVQPSTWESYDAVVRRYVRPALGEQPLEALHPRGLSRFYVELLSGGGRDGAALSLRTVRYVHAILHKALDDARRAGYLTANPTDDATLPRIHPTRADRARPQLQTWTAEQLRGFLAATVATPRGPLWAVAAGTGMRRGELLGLRWDDVDLDAGVLRVRLSLSRVRGQPYLKEPKTGRARRLRVDRHVVEALRAQQQAQARDARRVGPAWDHAWNLVFTTATGGPCHPDAVTTDFRQACRAAGAPPIRLHDLRHTHATLLLEAGVPVKVVSERLGHASVMLTLDIYAHVLPAMDADAVARFAAHVHGEDDV